VRIKSVKGVLLAFLLLVLVITSLLISAVLAKPVGRNPDYPNWGNGVLWGTKLWLENDLWRGQCFFGVGSAENSIAPPSFPVGLQPLFVEASVQYFKLVRNTVAEPQRYNWYVMMYTWGEGNPGAGTLSCPLENATHWFLPTDFSVVLENSAQGILVNLRKENKWFNLSSPVYATLYVDNAVNIQSIENLDPLTGKPGDTLRLRVTVKNTGRYTDNYTVSAVGSLDPTIPNLAPGGTDNVIVTTTLPSGTRNIVITAVGNYATDQDNSLVVTGKYLHAPILIVGNDNFTPANGVNGGSGTENDPYIIENWDISAENANGIDIRNTTAYFIVRNCYMHDQWENYCGIYFSNVTNGEIDNNLLENNPVENNCSGIVLANSCNNLIFNNIVKYNYVIKNGPLYAGIQLDSNSDNNSIENNTIDNNLFGIFLWHSSDKNLIFNNTVENNFYGIFLDNCSDNNLVCNNMAENNTWGAGVRLHDNSANNLVSNNTLESSPFGIEIETSDNNFISGNISENNQIGIYQYSSNNNLIENNLTKRNQHFGISLGASDNSLISNNTIENNGYGLCLASSENNRIYHNNFVNNWDQAYDDNLNYWDDGYPSGGNYWSDYTGVDYRRGENQDISGSDGIWDTPYYISGGSNLDRYPLRRLSLVTGWNLVCFTAVGANDTPANIFTGLTYPDDYTVFYWSAPTGPYTVLGPSEPFNDNTGYWVYIDTNITVSTSGIRPVSRDIYLVKGWNLVSFQVVNENTTPANVFPGLTYPTNYIIYYWNEPNGPYTIHGPGQAFQDNLGYWVWIDRAWTVTVP
jgi:parallel beta-helix repeat protein